MSGKVKPTAFFIDKKEGGPAIRRPETKAAPVPPGGQNTYTMTVTNNSSSAQSNVTLNDGLPSAAVPAVGTAHDTSMVLPGGPSTNGIDGS